jgi:hypothetical protein
LSYLEINGQVLSKKIRENYSKQEKNDKNFNKNELEPTSDVSDWSDSDTITGFKMSPKGRFYQTTPERHRELKYGVEGEDWN